MQFAAARLLCLKTQVFAPQRARTFAGKRARPVYAFSERFTAPPSRAARVFSLAIRGHRARAVGQRFFAGSGFTPLAASGCTGCGGISPQGFSGCGAVAEFSSDAEPPSGRIFGLSAAGARLLRR